MRVLHLEDYDNEKAKDYAKELNDLLIQKGIEHKNIETLSEFMNIEKLNDYAVIILDGQFPEEIGKKPDFTNFSKVLQILSEENYPLNRIIVWSNSTRVHAICQEKGLKYFSKKQMKEQDYLEKKVNPKAMAIKATTKDIANLIVK